MTFLTALRPALQGGRTGLLSTASTSSLLVASSSTTELPLPLPAFAFGGSVQTRNSTKRGGGSTKNNRNSAGRRLGVKRHAGQYVQAGQIIYRQRGTSWHPGPNAAIGKDHTIFATAPGFVQFYYAPPSSSPAPTTTTTTSPAAGPIRPLGTKTFSAPQINNTPHPSSKKQNRRYIGVTLDADRPFPRPASEPRQRRFEKIDLEALQRDIDAVKLESTA